MNLWKFWFIVIKFLQPTNLRFSQDLNNWMFKEVPKSHPKLLVLKPAVQHQYHAVSSHYYLHKQTELPPTRGFTDLHNFRRKFYIFCQVSNAKTHIKSDLCNTHHIHKTIRIMVYKIFTWKLDTQPVHVCRYECKIYMHEHITY